MSLKLFIDEDSLAKPLVKTLRKAGHDVVTVNEVGLGSQSDLVGEREILGEMTCVPLWTGHQLRWKMVPLPKMGVVMLR